MSATVKRMSIRAIALMVLTSLGACGGGDSDGPRLPAGATVYEGATIVVGDGSDPIENGVFAVADGRFVHVGPAGSVGVPRGGNRVDLSGRTVIPALVNAHVHLSPDPDERALQLRHMAYWGAGTVVSLGLDEGDAPFEMRGISVADGARSLTAGRGITTPEPGRSEVPYWVTTPDEARAAVQELAAQEVDIVKIWVDDRGGEYERLSPELYTAVIDEAHANGLKVTAHIFRLEDAKGLIRAGVDAFAHGIRDQDVDDELVELWLEHPNVVLVPNLPGPGVVEDLGWITSVSDDRIEEMQERQQERPAAQDAFGIQARNLARLSEAGVTIAFGTDGSTAWAVHQEMADMGRAGMSPSEIIRSATWEAARLMGLDDVGSIEVGKSADFVVLEVSPLDDVSNTRWVESVYLRGSAIDREAIAADVIAAEGR